MLVFNVLAPMSDGENQEETYEHVCTYMCKSREWLCVHLNHSSVSLIPLTRMEDFHVWIYICTYIP